MCVHRLASQWKSLQNDRNSLQQFQTAVEDFVGRLVAMETSLTSLAEETAKPGVRENAELSKEFLDQFHVSRTAPALLKHSPRRTAPALLKHSPRRTAPTLLKHSPSRTATALDPQTLLVLFFPPPAPPFLPLSASVMALWLEVMVVAMDRVDDVPVCC